MEHNVRPRPRPKSLALPASTPTLSQLGHGGGRGGVGSGTKTSGGTVGGGTGDMGTNSLTRNKRFEDETSAYKRRLDGYRQAQQQQALLVARLQSKVSQYKQRCSDLETKLARTATDPRDLCFDSPTSCDGQLMGDFMTGGGRVSPTDHLVMDGSVAAAAASGHWKLEQERMRNDSLIRLNRDLRNELEETRQVNNALSGDLQKLSDDWEKLGKQMADRENLWKAEEQAYSDFYASEHSKLLSLWKKVAAAKRDFAEMKASTGRDMAHLKNSVARVSNQISNAFITSAVSTPNPQQESEQSAFLAKLTQELSAAHGTQENLRKQIKDRDDKILGMETAISELDGKCQNLEAELNRMAVQELGLLQSSLREIGKLLLSDFDQHGLEDGHDVHLTSTPAIFIYDENGENPTVFAESIVSAVQAALNKRQLQIHQLQVSLVSAKEQALSGRNHAETLESELSKAVEKIRSVSEMNDKIKDAFENVKLERDTAQRNLDSLKNEKNILEQQRKGLASDLDSTLKMKNNLASSLSKVEKTVDNCRDEIEALNIELDKTREELSVATSQLKLEQEIGLKIREQLTFVGDDKERNAAENKGLKSQLNELIGKYEDVSFSFEKSEDALKKWKMDAEILGEKLRAGTERAETMEKEKKKWAERARLAEEERVRIETDLQDARNDLASLRRELLESERQRTDLEAKIENLVLRADSAENKKLVLENQLEAQRDGFLREMSLGTERNEIVTEELNHTRRELEDALQVLERTKADLQTAEKLQADATHLIESKEGAIKTLSDALDKLQHEKTSLEYLEEALKSDLVDKDKKIESMERQLTDIKSKMANELANLKDKLTRTETAMRSQREKSDQEKNSMTSNFAQQMAAIQTSHGCNEEKIKSEFEDKLKTLRFDLETEKKNEGNKATSEISALRQQIDSLRVQYEEALLRAENDKQQGLLLAQQDQQGLADKIRLLERELEDVRNDKDRIKRECETKCGHEKNAAAALRSELIKIRNELETTKQEGIETMKQIEIRLTDIDREREGALMHIEELRAKLRGAEERDAELKRELNDVHRKLKDAEYMGDSSKKEMAELRRTLSEMAVEKEKNGTAMEQVKEDLGRREAEVMILKKDLGKMQNKVKELDKIKADLEADLGTLTVKMDAQMREKSDTSRQLDDMQDQLSQTRSQNAKLDSEVTELKVKLEAETERRDEAESQWRSAKKLLDEAESSLAVVKGEEERLASKLAEVEERYGKRELQLLALSEDNKHREKKLMEEKHNLNICLSQVQQQMEHLQNKLGAAEGRLKVLSDERSDLERQRKESDFKLAQIQSGMKKMGIPVGSVDTPEAVRRAMAALQTQMAALSQDRDTVASQLMSTKETLVTVELARGQLQDQLNLLNRSLHGARGDTKTREAAIFNLEKELALKNGELARLNDKVREMEETVKSREDVTRLVRGEKDTLKEELDRARARFDEGRNQFESKWSKAEVNMRALEGDLNRMALVLQQKESHIQAMEDKCGNLHRGNADLEERCSSLTMTVEQLNIALEKTSQAEQDWKDKCNSLNRNVSENGAQYSQLMEKVRALQREKALLEQERNGINEKWEVASAGLQDFKRQVQILADKNQKLRLQTEEMTRNAIDKQLKTFAETGKDDMRQVIADKVELQRKLDSLMEKMRELERENRELERIKEFTPLSCKGGGRSPLLGPGVVRDNVVTALEEENSDLQRKISKLKAEIRELERRHVKHVGEVTTQVKQERDFELERARASKLQAERLLEAREANYRAQIQRLEQQVAHLKDQLSEEIRRRQSFLTRSFRTGQDIRSFRHALGDSLRNVSIDPMLDCESKRLDAAMDLHKSASQSSLLGGSYRDASPGYNKTTPNNSK